MMYVNALIVTGIITAIALTPTLLMINPVLASLGSSGGGKTETCNGKSHTVNYCSGFYRGKGDCEDGNSYKGYDKHHTKNWRDGYKAGWNSVLGPVC